MTKWKWKFSSPRSREELGDSPEALLSEAEVVKTNPVRKVMRTQGLYLKLDTRRGFHLRREWASAQLLASKGIPTVEHLAIGVSDEGELLITRELKDSMTLGGKILSLTRQDRNELLPLMASCAAFTRHLLDAGVFHPDYHSGNILFVPKSGQLALVDVCEVRRATLWDKLFWRYRMEGIILAFGMKANLPDLLDMLRQMGSRHPEKTYATILKHQAAHFYHSWPKRRRQILAGHHRYTVVENQTLHAVGPDEMPIPLTDAVPFTDTGIDHKAMFLAHFLLSAAQIPHRAALAYTPGTQVLLLAPSHPDAPIPHSLPQEFIARMQAFGWNAPLDHWRVDAFGIPYLNDISTVAQAVAQSIPKP